MIETKEENGHKETKTRAERNRWFALGLGFLVLNAWAILREKPPQNVAVADVPGEPAEGRADGSASPSGNLLKNRGEVRWEFSEAMVGEEDTFAWKESGPIVFDPPQAGLYCWETPQTLVFKPHGDWPVGQTIRARMGKPLHSLSGERVRLHASSFTTDRLALVAAVVETSGRSIRLHFNSEVRPDEVAKHSRLVKAQTGETVPVSHKSVTPAKSVRLEIPRLKAAHLELELAQELRPAHGEFGLAEPAREKLTIGKPLRVTGHRPVMRTFQEGHVYLKFSAPVSLEQLRGKIEIEPALPFQVLDTDSWWRGKLPDPSTVQVQHGLQADPPQRHPPHQRLAQRRGFHLQLLHAGPAGRPRLSAWRLAPLAQRGPAHPGQLGQPGPDRGLHQPHLSEQPRVLWNAPQQPLPQLLRLCAQGLVRVRGQAGHDPGPGKPQPAGAGTHRLAQAPATAPCRGVPRRRPREDLLPERPQDRPPHRHRHHPPALGGRHPRLGQLPLDARTRGAGTGHPLLGDQPGACQRPDGRPRPCPPARARTTWRRPLPAHRGKGPRHRQPVPAGDTDSGCDGPPGPPLPWLAQRSPPLRRPGHLQARRDGTLQGHRTQLRRQGAPTLPCRTPDAHPDQREGPRLHGMLSANGTVDFDVPWPATHPLGKYKFHLAIPGAKEDAPMLGTCTVRLEEFTAAKLEVAVEADAPGRAARPGEELGFEVSARHLAGRPASDLPAYAHVRYQPRSFEPEGWEAFTFEDAEKEFPAAHGQLKALGKAMLDAEGRATFQAQVLNLQPPAACAIELVATVNDVAGRPVTNSTLVPVQAYPLHVGIRKTSQPNSWEAAAVNPDGQPAPDGTTVQISLHRVTRTLLLRKDDTGHYRYQSERHLQEIGSFVVKAQNGKAAYRHGEKLPAGAYVIRARHVSGGASATLEFQIDAPGKPGQAWAGETPEKVELTFDKEDYDAGQKATLRIAAPFPGRALVTLQRKGMLRTRVLELGPDGTAQVQFEAKAAHFPNAWATAHVVRKVVPGEPAWQPHRAFGSTSLRINPQSRKLQLSLQLPERSRPSAPLTTTLELTDNAGQPVEGELALWLVDEGVLSLTEYTTPDPLAHFCADRRRNFNLHDPYGLLLPETDGDSIQNRLAVGAGGLPQPSQFLNPFQAKRFKNLALWKPAVRTDAQGRAEVRWDLPEFSGKVRVMAVAVEDARFGSAQGHVEVKRPFSVVTGLPRFLAPGDRFEMPVRLFNDSDQPLDIIWNLKVSEHLGIQQAHQRQYISKTSVGPAGTQAVRLPFVVGDTPGTGWVDITATAGDETYYERTQISIRPAAAREFDVHTGVLIAGEEFQITPGARFLQTTAGGRLETSPTPDALLGPALESLLKYPYGCLEQTTSGSLPLLYAEDLLRRLPSGKPSTEFIKEYVRAGVARVRSMQRSDGAFGWWPGASSAYHWGTLYATQFLLEARQAGFNVPATDIDRATRWIQDKLGAEDGSQADRLDLRAYAVEVLAQAGKLPSGWLNRLWELREGMSVEGRIRLAAAHIHAGDRRKAAELAKDLHAPSWNNNRIRSWNTLGSPLRTCALLLGLHVELDPGSAQTAKLAGNLQNALGNSTEWTTQENAMLVLAMGKYARHLGDSQLETRALVLFDGEPMESESARQSHPFLPGKLPGKLRLKNQGPGPLYYSFTVDGIPAKAPSNRADGLRIVRTIEGAGRPLLRGEVVKVELSIDTFGNEIDHLVIQDLLPAGLEIESSAGHRLIRHKEHRDDRFLLFPDALGGVQKFTYLARAVTAGEYVLPAPAATCMYDAQIQAFGQAGRLTIVEAP